MSCLKVINVQAIAFTGSTGPVLAISWSDQGTGSETQAEYLQVYINGTPYSDGNTGYTTFDPGITSIGCEGPRVPGGLQQGQTKTIFIRVHCLDGTNQDSDTINYVVPALSQPVSVKPKGKH